MPYWPNQGGALICCIGCGRDTSNKSGYCPYCGSRGRTHISDEKGRPARSSKVLAGTTSLEEYWEAQLDPPAGKGAHR